MTPAPPGAIERVGVAGAGTMGSGIAQLACLGGFRTVLHDPDPDARARGEQRVRAALLEGIDRGRWSRGEGEAASARLVVGPALEDLRECELVVEAAPESLELKRKLFAELSAKCSGEAILATNTSSLSVTAITATAEGPHRTCGMHFFNPPTRMRLVEVVVGDESSDETIEAACEVARRMGREPVRAADAIGFIGNRVNRPFTLEALRLAGDGVAPPDQIDRIVRIGGGYRMGPFELMDLVGIDVNFAVAKSFWDQSFGEPRWRPHPLQARMAAAGRLGRKSGRGWYDYDTTPHRPDDPEAPDPDPEWTRDQATEDSVHFVALPTLEEARVVEIAAGAGDETERAEAYFAAMGKHVERVAGDAPGLVLGRIACQLVNEAHFASAAGIGEPADIDTAMRLGFNHPRGPFEWANAIGPARVVEILDELHGELGEERYRVAPALRRAARGG
jgi:3-hydroxybutyryl-CoA dehydrogenase